MFLQDKFDESENYYKQCLLISQKYGRKDTIARAKLGLARISDRWGNSKEALNQGVGEAVICSGVRENPISSALNHEGGTVISSE